MRITDQGVSQFQCALQFDPPLGLDGDPTAVL